MKIRSTLSFRREIKQPVSCKILCHVKEPFKYEKDTCRDYVYDEALVSCSATEALKFETALFNTFFVNLA
jgi:hypothetical protein